MSRWRAARTWLARTRPGGWRMTRCIADAVGRLSRAIAGIHADPRFQEAITWQNPGLAQRLHDHDAGPDAPRRSNQRQRELVIASYLQRYCLKNDTIGFFGPVGWASAGHDGPALVVVPGEQLLARRTTYFEVWAIDKVAAEIARQGRALGWLRPRRTRSVFLAGNVLHRPHRQPVTLTDAELRILQACDGRRTISEVLEAAGAPKARGLLTRLAELGALRMDLEGPMDAWPERLLRDKLELIADPDARAAALEPVDQMVRARDAVAAAAGDPAGLRRALAGLAETFEQVTGAASTRRAGENYAGRTLVYQDAVRDVRVELGEAVTRALAAPLALVLDSARWLVNDITDRYREYYADLLDRESARAGGGRCRCSGCSLSHQPSLSLSEDGRGLGEFAAASVAEFQRRWQQVLGPPSSARRHQVSADAISAQGRRVLPRAPGHLERRPAALTGHHDRGGLPRRGGARQLPAGPRRDTPGRQHPGRPALRRAAPRPGPAHRRRAGRPRPAADRRHPAERPPERDIPHQPAPGPAGARPALLVRRHHRLARPRRNRTLSCPAPR